MPTFFSPQRTECNWSFFKSPSVLLPEDAERGHQSQCDVVERTLQGIREERIQLLLIFYQTCGPKSHESVQGAKQELRVQSQTAALGPELCPFLGLCIFFSCKMGTEPALCVQTR